MPEGGENVINYRILRRLRKLKDFNMADIAAYLDYASASSYHRLENGQIRPTVSQIRKLCQLYGVDAHHAHESVFKGMARALKAACRRDPRVKGVPSSKGVL